MTSNLKIVEDNIEVRLDHYIYAFSTNTIPSYLKIGDTSKGVDRRIEQWNKILTERLPLQQVILTEKYRHNASIKNEEKNIDVYFRDYSVHEYIRNVLHKNSIDVTAPNLLNLYSKEFFKDVTADEVDKAIKTIIADALSENPNKIYKFYSKENSRSIELHWKNDKEWNLRPNQETVVKNFLNKQSKKELLMYAVMRFGKSFTAMQCALKDNRDKVLIVCAKRDVQNEWKQTIEKPKCFKDYAFICDDDLKTGKSIKEILKDREKTKYAIFLTLQNISGKASDGTNIKQRLKDIFSQKYDLLIIDETHYGAWAKMYGQPISNDEDADCVKKERQEYKKLIDESKKIKAKQKLHLSGTPYNLLYDNKFNEDNIIATYQFKDILLEKEKWNKDHLLDIENGIINKETNMPYQEYDNPYFGFPKMLRFAFNLPEEWIQKLKTKSQDGVKWSLTELFKTKEVSGQSKFIHENEVIKLLKAIDGSSKESGILDFLNIPKIKDNDVCKHIVMVLPYRSSCDAMEALVIKHKNEFLNLCNYEKIINITGKKAPKHYSNIENIKNDISKCEEEGKKTISLTVHKMLTGVTVKEWDTMIMLKSTKSAQEYDQATFRIQNQYILEYVDAEGNIFKKDMKPQTILVDFDPARFFEIQGLSERIVDKVTNGNITLEDSIIEELKYFPIITYNTDKLVQVTANNLVELITKYNKNKSILDESTSVNLDENILKNEYLLKYISAQSDVNLSNKLTTNAHEGNTKSDILDPESSNNGNNTNTNTNNNKIDDKKYIKKYRMCIACILFYSFLTDSVVGKLEDILKSVTVKSSDLERNKRIFKNLKLDKKFIELHIKNCSRHYSFDLDNSIKTINLLSKDKNLTKEERIINALNRFSKISDSEVVTPENITTDMINLLPDKFFKDCAKNKKAILDIASKEGEFAIAIYKKFIDLGYNINQIKDLIYSIPTSTITYEFTRKIYETLGLNIDNIAYKFNSYDLLEVKKDNEIDYNKIKLILTQNKKFNEITMNDNPKKGDDYNMKFDAIVGNPPYQEETTKQVSSTNGQKRRKNIFHKFQIIADNITSRATVFIYPGTRWIHRAGKGMEEFGLKQINEKNLESIDFYPNSNDIFKEVSISDGLSIVYKNKYKQTFGFDYVYHSAKKEINVFMKNPGENLITLNPIDNSIVKKIDNFVSKYNLSYIHNRIYSQKLFGIESSFVEDNYSKIRKHTNCSVIDYNKDIKVFTNDKAGPSGRTQWFIVDKSLVKEGKEYINKWKVVVSSAHPGGQAGRSNQIEIIDNHSVFGRSRVALGIFETEKEAKNFYNYINTNLIRFMFLMTNESLTSLGKKVPDISNYTINNKFVDFNNDLNKQLYKLFSISSDEIKYIESMIKPME